jgi:hypothetical protein
MCVTVPTVSVVRDSLLKLIEALMKLQIIIVSLFTAAALATGCASSDPSYGSNGYQTGSAHSNENHYAVIDSIESGLADNGGNAIAHTATRSALASHEFGRSSAREDVYFIRVRFDDRSYRTVTQSNLDGLRVGDSVRIEDDRVRRY